MPPAPNITSTATPDIFTEIKYGLPNWFWIALGIVVILTIFCLCCCPECLLKTICFPFVCLICVVCCPVTCCLKCLGFEVLGPREGSYASWYQSTRYGGNTPSDSLFAHFQSRAMRDRYEYI